MHMLISKQANKLTLRIIWPLYYLLNPLRHESLSLLPEDPLVHTAHQRRMRLKSLGQLCYLILKQVPQLGNLQVPPMGL